MSATIVFVTQMCSPPVASRIGPVIATAARSPNVANAQNAAGLRCASQLRRQTNASAPKAAMLTYWSASASSCIA
jgi:hypothetical protein